MSVIAFVFHLVQVLGLTIGVLLLAIGAVIVLRRIGHFPTEFDRVGSDLSLYGYGVVLSFIVGLQLDRPVLKWIGPPQRSMLVLAGAFLISFLFYGVNFYISQRIRELGRQYPRGVESEVELLEVLSDPVGRRLMYASLALGFFPTVALVMADIFSE